MLFGSLIINFLFFLFGSGVKLRKHPELPVKAEQTVTAATTAVND